MGCQRVPDMILRELISWNQLTLNFVNFVIFSGLAWYHCGLRFSGFSKGGKKMALLPLACGEKNSVTSSSKNVSPHRTQVLGIRSQTHFPRWRPSYLSG